MTKKALLIAAGTALLVAGALYLFGRRPEDEPGEEGGEQNAALTTPDMQPDSIETDNFTLSEFACHDGTPVPAEYYGNIALLIRNLQALRDSVGLPIFINSGYRTPAYNASLKGSAKNSYHMKAMAADIRIPPYSPSQVKQKIEALIAAGKMQNGGIGLYSSFVHYDVGPAGRRWNG